MRKLVSMAVGLLLINSHLVFAGDFLAKRQAKLGQPVLDFSLTGLDGKNYKLSALKGQVVMLHFWSAQCPFVVRYEDRLKKITEDYTSKGVVVLGIDSNATETQDFMKKVFAERKLNYPVLVDPGHKIADYFGAITTPHVFILNKEGKLVYEGAIDNQGWSDKTVPNQHYVREALEALVAGKSVKKSRTKTAGCTIKRS